MENYFTMNTIIRAQDLRHAVDCMIDRNACIIRTSGLTEKIEIAINGFKELLSLPEEERLKWSIDCGDTIGADDGLIEKNGGIHDHKYFFHFRTINRLIPTLHAREAQVGRFRNFIDALMMLHASLLREMLTFLSVFNTWHPEYGLEERMRLQPEGTEGVLRLLYYKPGYDVMARPHFDQSLFTLHVADSHPGLIVGGGTDIYVPSENQLLLFKGMKAAVLTDPLCKLAGDRSATDPNWTPQGLIKPTYHTAHASNGAKEEGRWAIVFFLHCLVDLSSDEITEISKRLIALYKEIY